MSIYNRQNGHTLIVDGDIIIYDGVKYDLPAKIHGRNGRSVVQNGDNVYIDEYKFKNGKFRFSIVALLNKIF